MKGLHIAMTFDTRYRSFNALAAMMLCMSCGLFPSQAAEAQINKHLYSESANPIADISAAEGVANREHKRILLDFGGNWCGDCQLLDLYYQQQTNAEILSKYYVVVHVDIGHMDHNVAVAEKYHVPIQRGVPALAVLDAKGNLIYVERDKEFEHTSAEAVQAFLERWK